jgi:Ca2+:H+ antiporter
MTLAVIALIIPSAFAFALQATVGEETERKLILEMSRGSSIILIFMFVAASPRTLPTSDGPRSYISYMVFQLYSHSHYYNPDAEAGGFDSPESSRPGTPMLPPPPTSPPHAAPAAPPVPRTPGVAPMRQAMPGRRASHVPFGSKGALGARPHQYGQRPPLKRESIPERVLEKQAELDARARGQAGAATIANGGAHGAGTPRVTDYSQHTGEVEAQRRVSQDNEDEEEGPEAPNLNIPVAIGTLVAATGLTCKRLSDVWC